MALSSKNLKRSPLTFKLSMIASTTRSLSLTASALYHQKSPLASNKINDYCRKMDEFDIRISRSRDVCHDLLGESLDVIRTRFLRYPRKRLGDDV